MTGKEPDGAAARWTAEDALNWERDRKGSSNDELILDQADRRRIVSSVAGLSRSGHMVE
jgi:hypothetical protein